MKNIPLIVLLLAFLSSSVWGDIVYEQKTDRVDIQVEQIAEDLGIVWGMAFISPDEILFTERSGKIGIVSMSSGAVKNIEGVPPVMAEGQGGLMDVAVPAGFEQGDWIYLTYVKNQDGDGVTVLAKSKIANGIVTDWEDVLVTQSASNTGRHFGSRIAFDNQGHLFFTVGDRGKRPSAQDLTQHNGSVLRLNMDGSVPEDNPFVGQEDVLPAIWSYGHRNPQGIAIDHESDRLWVIEHGPRGGDEINLVSPAKNYGWPVISYGKEYWGPFDVGEDTHKEGMEQPKKIYTPSIAPSSLIHYTGDAFPEWQGNLLSGALKLTHISRVEVDSQGNIPADEILLDDFDERIRSLLQGPDGLIYFSTDSGKILRLMPSKN